MPERLSKGHLITHAVMNGKNIRESNAADQDKEEENKQLNYHFFAKTTDRLKISMKDSDN
jgi:hypothetical protein